MDLAYPGPGSHCGNLNGFWERDYGWGVRVRRHLAHAGGSLYGTELGSVTLKKIGFFCFPIKHSTHTKRRRLLTWPSLSSYSSYDVLRGRGYQCDDTDPRWSLRAAGGD